MQKNSKTFKYLVGLTGGIGSGKSAAADRFCQHGIKVVDADIASRVVVEPGRPALTAISDHFGEDILLDDGNLDRAKLREKIFADNSQRHWLQTLLHPLITQYLREEITSAESIYAMLVNPLLLETKQDSWCNRVVVVDAPESMQLDRTMKRDDNSRDQVERIMAAQTNRALRLQQANDVINNDQDLEYLYRQVDALHSQFCQYAEAN